MWTKLAAGTLVIGLVAGVAWVAGMGDDATAIRPIVVTSSQDRDERTEPSPDPVREPPPARTDGPADDPPAVAPGSGGGGDSAPQHDDTDDDDEREDDDDDSDDD